MVFIELIFIIFNLLDLRELIEYDDELFTENFQIDLNILNEKENPKIKLINKIEINFHR